MTPLTAPLPLRWSSALGTYRDVVPLAHRYGATSGALIQMDTERRRFVWADHSIDGIDEVRLNGQVVGNWTWRNDLDRSGHAVAVVEFDQAPDEGARLLATGRGKRHPRTGALLTNPADVLWDLLAAVAGYPVAESTLEEFRADCTRAGLEVAGSVETADSAQTVVRGLCAGIGAVFCADARALAWLWPGGDPGARRACIDARQRTSAGMTLADLVTDLTVRYDWQDGAPRQTLQLDAPDAIARYGRRADSLDARWIASPRVAYAVAVRLLQQRARPQWTVRTEGLVEPVAVGDAVDLDHPVLPVGGRHTVLGRELSLATGTTTITCVVPVGAPPVLRLVAQSSAIDPRQYAGVGVQTVGGERVLTLREDDGRPIVGAAVTLDGQTTRTTDAGGRVSFPATLMSPGEHTLVIQTADGRRLTTTVLIQ